MHFIVSWDIKVEGESWDRANAAMKESLSGYSWVKPLTTLYIVKVRAESDYESVKENMKDVARNSDVTIHFVVTPIMNGGTYNGWLPKRLWPMIRKRAQEDD